MGSIGTIYTYPYNPRVMKVQAAAALNGRTVSIAPNFIMTETNRSPEFLHDFPLGKVPAFRSVTGIQLFESDAIAQYAAEMGPMSTQLLGSSADERALIRQWIGFADHELFEPLQSMVLWRYGMGPYNEGVEATSLRRLEVSLDVLERHLRGREYLVSSLLSLADLSVAAAMVWGFGQVVDKEMRGRYPVTVQWYLRVIEQDKVKQVFGEPKMIEVRVSPPGGSA
ncbi:Putative Translation elongation factor eEF-1B gamma subunit [Aspergillus calidoustus]|uniref:Putative Translation elongation factor eEF-1B gamma subunit n=1 Tax=Aspergillus calidoustus TaxID=454130 RepID=A0A0U5CNE4_ASPCI|nr:Putative Translation elongation factor eEF-1B gamma subunit [Aspergillus calidoustus]